MIPRHRKGGGGSCDRGLSCKSRRVRESEFKSAQLNIPKVVRLTPTQGLAMGPWVLGSTHQDANLLGSAWLGQTNKSSEKRIGATYHNGPDSVQLLLVLTDEHWGCDQSPWALWPPSLFTLHPSPAAAATILLPTPSFP